MVTDDNYADESSAVDVVLSTMHDEVGALSRIDSTRVREEKLRRKAQGMIYTEVELGIYHASEIFIDGSITYEPHAQSTTLLLRV